MISKIKFLILISLLCDFYSSQLTPLDEYVFNEDDRSFVKYNVLYIKDQTLYKTHKLKVTTLKWFDGRF